jgi:hypothetical protein
MMCMTCGGDKVFECAWCRRDMIVPAACNPRTLSDGRPMCNDCIGKLNSVINRPTLAHDAEGGE